MKDGLTMIKKEPKDFVTIHACERFATRIMGLEVEQNGLTFPQINGLTQKIFNIALECYPNILEMGQGAFTCSKYECVIVLQDGIIVTVKHVEKDVSSDYTGGVHRSGTKRKKLVWTRKGGKDGDNNGNNVKYPITNGNRYDKKSKRSSLREF